MITRAVQLPEIRSQILTWLMKSGPTMFATAIKAGKMPILRPGSGLDDDKVGLFVAQEEARRLAAAELFWVDDEMTDLVIGAASSMPDFNLMPEDLPSPSGLIVFEKTLQQKTAHDEFADAIYVRAAAWGPITERPGCLWVSWYTDTALNFETVNPQRLAKAFDVSMSRVSRLPRWRQMGLPPLTYENEDWIPFSEKPLPSIDPVTGEEADGSEYPLKELVTAWTLMQQPIAKTTDAHFDRATRRRMEREKIEPRPVRVITLRRPKSTSEHGESDRDYHHQWIVRGHWRQQWYPSREVHRPVWIAPHIKGPEGAPLLGGDKVYAWTR